MQPYLQREAGRADAEESIEIGTGNAAARAVAVEQFVEPQPHHLVVLTLEPVHAAATKSTALYLARKEKLPFTGNYDAPLADLYIYGVPLPLSLLNFARRQRSIYSCVALKSELQQKLGKQLIKNKAQVRKPGYSDALGANSPGIPFALLLTRSAYIYTQPASGVTATTLVVLCDLKRLTGFT